MAVKKKILIEANKLLEKGNDGVKRYLKEYVKALKRQESSYKNHLEIYLYIEGAIIPLEQIKLD